MTRFKLSTLEMETVYSSETLVVTCVPSPIGFTSVCVMWQNNVHCNGKRMKTCVSCITSDDFRISHMGK